MGEYTFKDGDIVKFVDGKIEIHSKDPQEKPHVCGVGNTFKLSAGKKRHVIVVIK